MHARSGPGVAAGAAGRASHHAPRSPRQRLQLAPTVHTVESARRTLDATTGEWERSRTQRVDSATRRIAIGLHAPPPAHEESVKDFIYRHLGEAVYKKIIDPFVSGVYAGDPTGVFVRVPCLPASIGTGSTGG